MCVYLFFNGHRARKLRTTFLEGGRRETNNIQSRERVRSIVFLLSVQDQRPKAYRHYRYFANNVNRVSRCIELRFV